MAVPLPGDLEDYWWWVDSLVAKSGGWLEHKGVLMEPITDQFDLITGLRFPTQRLTFGTGVELEFKMNVIGSLELTSYRFQAEVRNGLFLWRKDKHQGHPEIGEHHIHRGAFDSDPEPFAEVDLEEVLYEVHDYHENGTLP